MRSLPRLVAPCLAALVAAAPALAQFSQYTAPGSAGAFAPNAGEAVRAAAEEARWHFGRLALDPVFELREIAWIDPGEGEDGDLTASFAAGLRGYLPVGSRSTFVLHAIPQYVWWRERDDESRVAGEAGLGLIVDANRLQLDVRASGSDLNGFVASELERRARVESRALDADATFLLSTKIGLWVHGSRSDHEAGSEIEVVDDPIANLDRAERTIEGGVRWYPTASLSVDVGVGRSRTTFDDLARDRSNEGESLAFDLGWNRRKLGATISVREREVDGEPGSEFGRFSGSTGSARIRWSPRDSVTLALFGLRDLAYTALDESAWFLDERIGGQVDFRLGRRVGLSLFVEEGERRFESDGVDDVSSTGGSLTLGFGRLELRVGGRATELEGVHGRQSYSEATFGLAYGKLRGAWY